jgi:arylsulfatase A
LIANWPGRIAAGKVNSDLIGSVDFLATICDAAGAAHPTGSATDGQSFFPQLVGERGQPREWLYSWYARDGGAKPQWEYVMSTRYKLYRDGRFFDLTADPFESKPLSVSSATGPAAAAAKSLQGALARFATARPAHVSAAGAMPGAKGKKNAEKGKKKDA